MPAPKASGATRNFTAADKGKTIEMKTGEKISISLVGIPTAGYVWAGDTRLVYMHVRRLRGKIGHEAIETVRGAGYKMVRP